MERTPREVPHGTYTMEGTSWTLHHGISLMELTPWKLPHRTYTIEFASLNVHH